MKTTYGQFIKHLRETRGFSQAGVAGAIGMSRPSYVALEKGTKELSLKEAVALVAFFTISMDELLRTQVPDVAKYQQMIMCYLREAKRSGKVLKKTKLAKLLYLADFAWYRQTRESMSGMTYRKLEFGPMSESYLSLIESMEQGGQLNIKQVLREDYHMYELGETRTSEKTKLMLLGKPELQLLKTIWKKWKEADTKEIVGFTQSQVPFKEAERNGIISYDAIMREDPAFIY